MSHPFLEVLLSSRKFGALGCSGLFPEGAAIAGHPRFVELPLLAFFLRACCAARSSIAMCTLVVCFGIQSGGKPFFGKRLIISHFYLPLSLTREYLCLLLLTELQGLILSLG